MIFMRSNSVSTVTVLRGSISGRGTDSLLCRSVQTGFRVHPTSYHAGTGGTFPVDKAAGAWSWPLASIKNRG